MSTQRLTRSLSPKRAAYIEAGEPYGKNRKSMKRWLRDVKSGVYFDLRDAWVCNCGDFITDGCHCPSCGAEPPWGCPCSWCQDDRYADDEDDGYDGYDFDPYDDDDDDDDEPQWWEEEDEDEE